MKVETHPDLAAVRTYGLSFPEAWEDFPWGHSALKVRKKAFAFLGRNEEGLANMSVKLPDSCEAACAMPGNAPTGYGLGKSGWVTITVRSKNDPPTELLKEWLVESYVAVAPKTLGRKLTD